jgi:hypothetical protein
VEGKYHESFHNIQPFDENIALSEDLRKREIESNEIWSHWISFGDSQALARREKTVGQC